MNIHHILFVATACTSVATAAITQPTDLEGLSLWLRGDRGALNANGLQAENGEIVVTWQDQSGNENHVTNILAQAPSLRTLDTGGHPAIYSAGGCWLDPQAPIATRSIFLVGRPPTTTDTNPNVVFNRFETPTDNGSWTIDLFIRHGTNDAISLDGTKTTSSVGSGSVALNGDYLTEVSGYTGRGFNLPAECAGKIPDPFLFYVKYNSDQPFTQFMRRGSKSSPLYYRGSLAEVIVYNRVLTSDEEAQIGSYLKAKYGLTATYPDIESAMVTTFGANRIADTHAQLNYLLAGTPDSSMKILAYYGTTDGGDDVNAWEMCDTNDMPNITGAYAHTTEQLLTVDTTYYCRFAIADGSDITFSEMSHSFTTHPVDQSLTFRYIGGPYATNVWTDAAQWQNLAHLYREYPNYPGDIVEVLPGNKNHDYTELLEQDAVFGHLVYGHSDSATELGGYLRINNANTEQPATLTLDSGTTGQPATIVGYSASGICFGTAEQADQLTLNLASPLNITKTTPNRFLCRIDALLTGGTRENPAPITCNVDPLKTAVLHLYLGNPHNSFIGNIIADGAVDGAMGAFIYCGRTFAANDIVSANDGVFGHSSNEIILRNGAVLALIGASGDGSYLPIKRTIRGSGSIFRVVQGENQANTDSLHATLADSALIAPGEGRQLGRLSLLAKNLTSTANSTIRLKVRGNTNDVFHLEGRATYTLSGRLELTGSPRYNTTYTLMTSATQLGTLTLNFSYITPGYNITKTKAANGSWVVKATYTGDLPIVMGLY